MESSSSKREREAQNQAEIRRQIAALQAQLNNPSEAAFEPPSSPKRSRPTPGVIVPSTPSPKKRKLSRDPPRAKDSRRPKPNTAVHSSSPQLLSSVQPCKPAPSTVLQKLASAHAKLKTQPVDVTATRSSGFAEKPAPNVPVEGASIEALPRDDRLALVEDLVPGPYEHKPPFDDPRFEKLEPNSGIRLSSRSTPHEDFQEYLRGRYYLSPSKLYSVVRLLPNKQGYDVPVAGDWLTIAVVAERSKVKQSQAPVGLGREDKTFDGDEEGTAKGKRPRKEDPPKPSGKKYVNMKLVDFGCRSGSSSATGGKAVIRGDASLSLLLFEADRYDLVTKENGRKEKIYKGGSRGAFEKMSVLREGAVVAFLNPRILKPFQRSADAPHPTDNILAITPDSVNSIAVIGYSQDLGMCKAVKRDGSACGSWCDRRVSDVCDYHIQHAVERKRAGRAEFSTGTSGMSAVAKKRKPAFDAARQWGLKPADDSGGHATYVVSGHIVSGSNDSKSLFVSEAMGREAQAKASRKISAKDADLALQKLLKSDKEGTRALMTARAKKGKRKLQDLSDGSDGERDADEVNDDDEKRPRKNVYSAQLIRQLGFDPTVKDGKRSADVKVQGKLDALAALQASRKNIQLGPRPGKKKSCVHRPENSSSKTSPTSSSTSQSHRDIPIEYYGLSDDDDLEREEAAVFGRAVHLTVVQTATVDLDGSDVDLEIEPPT
ncbi:hypothetical protein POSPLADRAFT_1142839 [Postia placenta MAD-698-R-SB12]|uniref:Zinc finger Mcm10/DnaG-type domain-containing protein n=1 Tax=Postia placenta MAD-698-R-SB12 TaxID=670580 RepID=A0A1X6N0X7_9APHY|nr:hypothetical protein POSPLADRAFT_1142839 [Postia placenta MAD-698-R-SB12]OSX62254.1 hypothetical protein POSPLADRAFT_1142839 [Postia placenta MAD-698-R-SB12]